jgi:hypothetical protein
MVDFWGIEISTGVGAVGAGALGAGAVGAGALGAGAVGAVGAGARGAGAVGVASPPPAGWANAVGPTSRINHMTLNALDMFDLASIVDGMNRI